MIDSLRMNSGIGNLGEWADGSDMGNFLHLISEAILANDIEFGFIRSFIRDPSLMNLHYEDLYDLAEGNVPFVNIFDRDVHIMDFNLNAIRNSIAIKRLAITMNAFQGTPMRVRIPVPVSLKLEEKVTVSNEPFTFSYANNMDGLAGPTNMTIRSAIKIDSFSVYLCSVSRRALELNPDSTIDGLNLSYVYSLERGQTNNIYLPLQGWLDNCAAYFNHIFANSIDQIEYVSFLDFEKQN